MTRSASRRPAAPARPRTPPLHLEALEDRQAPAVLTVTDPGDTSPGNACSAYLSTYGTGPSSDFSMATVNEPGGGTVVPVVGTTSLGSGTLVWANNPGQDQTPCSGQALQLNVAWS